MLPVHALVSLADAKGALRIRTTDSQRDADIEGIILEATDFVEGATGRRIIWRALSVAQVLASGAVADGTLAVTAATTYPFLLSYEWTTDPGDVTCDVAVTGLRAGVAVSESVHLPYASRQQYNGSALFDSVASVTISNTTGADSAAIRLVAAAPYIEKHRAEGQKHLYVVHRPIITLVKAEDGEYDAGESGWLTLPESMFFVNSSLGKVSRVAKTRAFVDFPEDYYFRYPQRAETGFGPWAPDARLSYFGGYLQHTEICYSLKTAVLLVITGIYRERERKDADLESSTNSVGSSSRGDWRKTATDSLKDERRMTGSGEGMPS